MLEAAFARQRVESFLSSVQKTKLRARRFEAILAAGLLGSGTPAKYAALATPIGSDSRALSAHGRAC